MEGYSRKGLVQAANEGRLWDYVANFYPQMGTYDLKEVVCAILGVVYDNCGAGASKDEDYEAFQKLVVEELADRDFTD